MLLRSLPVWRNDKVCFHSKSDKEDNDTKNYFLKLCLNRMFHSRFFIRILKYIFSWIIKSEIRRISYIPWTEPHWEWGLYKNMGSSYSPPPVSVFLHLNNWSTTALFLVINYYDSLFSLNNFLKSYFKNYFQENSFA